MKILHIGKPGNVEKYTGAKLAELSNQYTPFEILESPINLPDEEYLKIAADADYIIVDAIGKVTGSLIRQMPNLKMIHSEGVAYNSIDLAAARECGVLVCNCQGMNAHAVAEQTVLLMVGMLRGITTGDRAVREGRQITVKENYMVQGNLHELADCTIGLVGFGDIAKATTRLLQAYGVENILYTKRTPLTREEETAYGIRYASLDDLLAASDMVSLHLPVNPQTSGMVNADFFTKMKNGSYLVNTSRGELVDDEALLEALRSGRLSMAGLDTLDHEPVQPDHPLINSEPELQDKLLFSPHIGGITASSFRRGYSMVWEDIETVERGEIPARNLT